MTGSTGRVATVFGNMVVAEVDGAVTQNAVAYCQRADGARLMAEIIRVRGHLADLQVFEETRGLRVGDAVEFSQELLSVSLGPGLLGQIYDGLQNPLPGLAEKWGFFLRPGAWLPGLQADLRWRFTPSIRAGQVVHEGDTVGTVPEGIFAHRVMVPFGWRGRLEVVWVAEAGECRVTDRVAVLRNGAGAEVPVSLQQNWPVKVPLGVGRRLLPEEPLVTGVRAIDTMFPVARGGTYCIPGPFGSGKTVLQQIMSRYADVDVVVVAACGERASEVVETLRSFPELEDPRTGRSLMERTIIVCNTSAMPVAAREASVYTAVTMGEYYRQMGLHVLVLADSTSRWAQAMRELSGRLEEIPGDEAFPAYLESRIAAFYERAGVLALPHGGVGSLTIGGTVSPAGGNLEEPVTQATLKVVGAFHGLSAARAHTRRFPAIAPLESWSKYAGVVPVADVARARGVLERGEEVRQMMTVVGEEGVSLADYLDVQRAELLDVSFLQQNAFDPVDAATPAERQRFVFARLLEVVALAPPVETKDQARRLFLHAADLFRNWNYAAEGSEAYREALACVDGFIAAGGHLEPEGAAA